MTIFSRQIEVCQIVNWNYKAKLTIFDGKNYERKIRLFLKGVFGFFEILKFNCFSLKIQIDHFKSVFIILNFLNKSWTFDILCYTGLIFVTVQISDEMLYA